MNNKELLLKYQINKILDRVGLLGHNSINTDEISNIALQDLNEFLKKDPAVKNNYKIIINSYLGFRAVLGYRVANYIINNFNDTFFKEKAIEISEIIKRETGIEIHPLAKIGKSFVLDHGYGTVIGETTIIGNNCYILQCVVIGSRGIANNKIGKRHPTIGNNVEIGAFCRIYGNIKIGNNVFIAPNNVITTDILDNSKIINSKSLAS